jgi:predicted methyltransferase
MALGGVIVSQRPPTAEEIEDAERGVPLLVRALGLRPGMTVGDVGAGFGAWTLTLAKWLTPAGRVYTTDIARAELAALRAMATEHRLANVTVVESTHTSTRLPRECCDAILMRDVYHHLTRPAEFNRTVVASLKPRGWLAIVDFPPRAGWGAIEGVPTNRGGHGVPPPVVIREITDAGLQHVQTIPRWPPGTKVEDYYLLVFRKPTRAPQSQTGKS